MDNLTCETGNTENRNERRNAAVRIGAYGRVTLVSASVALLNGITAVQLSWAAPFSVSMRENLNIACAPEDPRHGIEQPQANLDALCKRLSEGPNVASAFSSIPPGAPPQIEQRLQSVLAEEEETQGRRGGTHAFDSAELFAQRGRLQLPPAGGASPGIVFGLGPGANAFFSAGAYAINHYNNRFEDGYEAQLPTVTIGADYRVNDWLLAGLALNYTNYDGTYDDGGGFDKHIFGPLLYATFLPFQGAFANLVLGYVRQENENNRLASASSTVPGSPPFRGHTSADYSEDQFTAGIFAGYDQPFGNLMIGPRLGLAVSHDRFENFQEEGNTGLELRYTNLNQTSVQSSLGVQASIGIETTFGIVIPQAAVVWVHEYANDDRNIDARLIDAPPAVPSFTFQREPPARDWASIGLGVSAVLPNRLEPFVQFATVQGNENFVSYGGIAGLRFGL